MNGFKNKLAAGLMFGAFIIFPFANFYNSSITTKLRDLQNQLWSYIMAGGKQEAEKKQESFNVPNTAEKELNITPSGAKTYEEYSGALIEIFSKVSFTDEEFVAIKKDAKNRPFSMEEMAQRVVFGANQDYFRPSFKAWQNLDEKSIVELKKIAVSQNMASIHSAIVSWYKYYGQFSKKLAEENLSAAEIKALSDQYQKNAGIFNQRLQIALAKPKSLAKNGQGSIFDLNPFLAIFSNLIPTALAQSAAPVVYNFGGMIKSYGNFCTNGFAVIVGPPQGGLLWIYHPVYIANPFMYKILAPKVWVLGRAIWGPGVCNQGKITYPYGQAQIVFFGSSLI